jgi:MSHA biogenesis protein MshJ
VSQWQLLSDRFSQLQRREKSLLFFGSLLLLLWLSVIYVLEPLWHKTVQTRVLQVKASQQLQDAQQQAEVLLAQLSTDLNQDYRERISNLEQQQQQLNERIRQSASHFIGAEQMVTLLRNILQSSKGVQLKSLLTSAPKAVRLQGQQPDDSAMLFQHTTTLVVAGGYTDLFRALQRMEQLPWLLNWSALNYQVVEYPQAELTLTLITVSEYEDFIRL